MYTRIRSRVTARGACRARRALAVALSVPGAAGGTGQPLTLGGRFRVVQKAWMVRMASRNCVKSMGLMT
ncbi:hypothetical protein GCM10008959_12620 [Deinococcus seoulensis]|uniref:Uncharacterized protein n=1 Tax=Deinococcus seoulensis TaxID=1837379 RepID=A0ABQ2RRI2_9DEIO|nr:hypothetical protein GCM10008959_12620 [Deinococcus seoulensis]